jgi:hypothetical protein
MDTINITISSPIEHNRYVLYIIKYYLNLKISLKFSKNTSFNFSEFAGSRSGTGNYCYNNNRDYSSQHTALKIVKLYIIKKNVPFDLFYPLLPIYLV